MFGREYSKHLDLLMYSYREMNENYLHKAHSVKSIAVIEKLKRIFILTFGVPEIGFQLRSIYFTNFLTFYIPPVKYITILDAGCGLGLYTLWLSKKFPTANITGGDIDKHKLKSCNVLAKEFHAKNVSFKYFDIIKTPKKERYNIIITIDVLEHVKNYTVVLRNFYRLLNKNGYLYIHVPQPYQKRIFQSLRTWHHDDHVIEGIDRHILEKTLKKIGFKIIVSKETFGFFGKLAWELNHILLAKNFLLVGITFPFLYILATLDLLWNNTDGLGVAVLAQKK